MTVKVEQIIRHMEGLAPKAIAENWDNPGLHIGDPKKEVKKILVALDPVEEVAEEAVKEKADMLITHHPFFFDTVRTLREDRAPGRITALLIRNDVALYCAHTNLDNARGGINDYLAKLLGVEGVKALEPLEAGRYEKIVVFVPEGYEKKVFSVMSEAGAGWIGNYSHCTFRTKGIGTFKPGENTAPFIGEEGKLEQVKEYRVETIVPVERIDAVIKAMLAVHPYEEVAYDLYTLENKRWDIGPGRIGTLAEATPLVEFIGKVKHRLDLKQIRYSGRPHRVIKRVALCGGSGGSLINIAAKMGADVFLTGDVKHHDAHRAAELGMAVVDAGHYGTEKVAPEIIKEHVERYVKGLGSVIEVVKSNINTDPLMTF